MALTGHGSERLCGRGVLNIALVGDLITVCKQRPVTCRKECQSRAAQGGTQSVDQDLHEKLLVMLGHSTEQGGQDRLGSAELEQGIKIDFGQTDGDSEPACRWVSGWGGCGRTKSPQDSKRD